MRILLLALCLLTTPLARAEELDPEKAIGLPGVAGLLPKEISATDCPDDRPCLAAAAMVPATATGTTSVVALAIESPAAVRGGEESEETTRSFRLLVVKLGGEVLLDRAFTGYELLGLDAGGWRPDGKGAVSFQWNTGEEGHVGPLLVWSLGDGKPAVAFDGKAEAQYLRRLLPGKATQLIVYEPEPDSAVCLPAVYDWREEKLVKLDAPVDALEKELLAGYDAVLGQWRSEPEPGDPPLMVLHAALSKGRLLERRGDRKGAFEAYRDTVALVPASLAVPEEQAEEREDVLSVVAEARRRAAALFGMKVAPPGGK